MFGEDFPNRSCVALLTDFGREGFYVGVMKAVISNAAPEAHVVDVTHDVKPYAVAEGSFILRSVFPFFPSGTIFVAVVDPGVGGNRNNHIFRCGDKYVVAPDNGLITDLSSGFGLDACWKIVDDRMKPYRVHPPIGNTFLGRDIFAPAAGALAAGAMPEELGTAESIDVETLHLPQVIFGKSRLEGYGRHIDCFGNVLTNITGDHLFDIFEQNEIAGINIRVGGHEIKGVRNCYVEEPPGKLMVVLNSWNLIEVSVSQGRADKALSISKPSEMHIILEA